MVERSKLIKKSPPRTWKIGLLSIGLSLVLILGLVLIDAYEGSAEAIRKVADKLKVDPEWKLASENIQPPKIICMGNGNPCPSVHRVWDTGERVTSTQFEEIIRSAGWNLSIDSCAPIGSTDLPVLLCSAEGAIDGYKVKAYTFESSKRPHTNSFAISVRPNL